jgi:hypothetical protein
VCIWGQERQILFAVPMLDEFAKWGWLLICRFVLVRPARLGSLARDLRRFLLMPSPAPSPAVQAHGGRVLPSDPVFGMSSGILISPVALGMTWTASSIMSRERRSPSASWHYRPRCSWS